MRVGPTLPKLRKNQSFRRALADGLLNGAQVLQAIFL